ncbi:MAG: O-antigen ligase family protein [Candidatus Omnitrophica bacterium]|nr:O-antigen ligase family protein [Candidatus Omnitrophota bacterium]
MTFALGCVLAAIGWSLLSVTAAFLYLSPLWVHPWGHAIFFRLTEQWLMEGVELFVGLGAISAAVVVWRKQPSVRVPWLLPWTVWLAWLVASIVWSVDRGTSARMAMLWGSYGVLSLVMALRITHRGEAIIWMRFLGWITVVIGLHAVMQWVSAPDVQVAYLDELRRSGHLSAPSADTGWWVGVVRDMLVRKRVASLFGWPNAYAGFLLLTTPIVLALGRRPSINAWAARGWMMAGGALCLLLVATRSGSGIIAAAVTGVMAWWLLRHPRLHGAFAIVIGALVAVAAGVMCFRLSGSFQEMFLGSMRSRLVYLHGAWHLLKDHPLAGTGIGTFHLAYRSLIRHGVVGAQHMSGHAHNTLVEFGVELGAVGLIGVLVFLRSAWQVVKRACAAGPLEQGLALGVLGFFIHSLLEWTWFEPLVAPLWWLALGLLTGLTALRSPKPSMGIAVPPRAVAAALLAAGACGVAMAVKFAVADSWWARAEIRAQHGQRQEAAAAVAEARRWDPWYNYLSWPN